MYFTMLCRTSIHFIALHRHYSAQYIAQHCTLLTLLLALHLSSALSCHCLVYTVTVLSLSRSTLSLSRSTLSLSRSTLSLSRHCHCHVTVTVTSLCHCPCYCHCHCHCHCHCNLYPLKCCRLFRVNVKSMSKLRLCVTMLFTNFPHFQHFPQFQQTLTDFATTRPTRPG